MDALDLQRYGNILDKMPQEGLAIIESKSKVRYSRSRANDSRVSTDAPLSNSSSSNNSFDMQQIAASLEDKMTIKMNQMMNQMKALVVTPAPVKAVEEVCVTCGSNHNFNHCPLTRGGNDFPVFQDNIQQFQQTAAVDFENYVKANDAVLKNVQNQGQNLQNQMANVTSLLTSLCDNFKNSASTSNPGTLPSQTVTNPRQQINAITTRSGKTLEKPSTPLVPTPDVSISQNEPKQNPETSTEKVQNPNLANTAHVPPPREEDSIFMEIPKPKAKETVSLDPNPNSYPSKLPYPERMKVRGHDKSSAQYSRPEKLEDPGKFLIPCALQELDRTSALADSGASINLLPHSIYKKLGLEALTPTRMTLELANRSITHPMGIAEDVVVRVDGFTFLADFVVVNFEPDPRVPIILGRPFLRTTKALIDFLLSNPLFEFDDSFKSSNVNPLFEENDKDVEIKSSSSVTLTSPEENVSIPPGIDLTLPTTLEVSSSNPTSPTLTGEKVCSWKTPMFFSLVRFVWKMMTRIAIRKKIICLLATFLHKRPKPPSRPQEVEEIKEKEDEVSSDVPIHTIVMPIRITFDNPIDFNDHFSKPKDLKKDLTISFDSTTTSILPHPLLDSDSPFTAELSASVTLNSLGNEDKVFKPVFKEPSFLLPPPEPPDECLKNVVLNFYQSKKTFPLNVEDVNSFTFIIWTFLPFFTYTKESPLIFSFQSENFIFDPGIITVAVSMKVSIYSP
ncbi:reverse transcriptase domain-containing protein [Tanacetum coccineum]